MRAATALNLTPAGIFAPMLGVQIAGLVFVFAAAWFLGKREEKRLKLAGAAETIAVVLPEPEPGLRRPGLFWLNLIVAMAVMAVVISGKVEPALVFMAGLVVALVLNLRKRP